MKTSSFLLAVFFSISLSACTHSNPSSGTSTSVPETSPLQSGGATNSSPTTTTPVQTSEVSSPTPSPTGTPVVSTCPSAQTLTFSVVNTLPTTWLQDALSFLESEVTKLFSGSASKKITSGMVKVGNYYYQLASNGKINKYASNGTQLLATYNTPVASLISLATDGTDLLASNGSNVLYRMSVATVQVISQIKVLNSSGSGVSGLSGLEYAAGQIFASLSSGNQLVRIDPVTGCQTAGIDLSFLSSHLTCSNSSLNCKIDTLLNSIVYDISNGTFSLTGKDWPTIFQGVFK